MSIPVAQSSPSRYPTDIVAPTQVQDANGVWVNNNPSAIPSTIPDMGTSPIPSGGGNITAQGAAGLGKDDPCSLFNCLSSFEKNARYRTGTAGQIASNIAVDIALLMTYVAGSIAIIFVLVGAFKILTSEGDSKKYEDGIKSIRYAVTGLVFSVLAYGLIAIVLQVLGAWSR